MQVLAVLRGIAEEVVGAAVPDAEPLMAAGLDSLGAVELRTRVQERLGVELPATVAFDHPTLQVGRAHPARDPCPDRGSVLRLVRTSAF